jgi:hypothetical protein
MIFRSSFLDSRYDWFYNFFLVGCWGVKINKNRLQITSAAKTIFSMNHSHDYDYDQILLEKFVWPIARTNLVTLARSLFTKFLIIHCNKVFYGKMAHDSYCCMIFHPTRPFPTRRKDKYFVAARAQVNGKTEELGDTDECPRQCLPSTNISSDYKLC